MFLVLVYCISLSILQITGVSVTWNSPASRIYSSINSKSVPIYNGRLQQQSSTIQPFSISGGTLTSLNANQNLEMSSNRGLGLNTNKILVRQDGQLADNNGDGVSENTITNTGSSEISGGFSKSSTNIQNVDIPVQVKGPELSSIYHGINKNSETSRINDVSKLYESSGIDRGLQLGNIGILEEEGRGFNGPVGSMQFGKQNEDRVGGFGGEEGEEEEGRGFSGSKGSIRFHRKNENRAGGSGGEEEGEEEEGRGFSGSKGSIRVGKQNDDRFGGMGGEEGGIGFSGSKGSIRFGGKNDGRFGGMGEEEGGVGFSGSKGSIRFGGKNDGRFGGMGGEEGGIGFSGSKGSIRFGGKNGGRFGGSGGEEGGIGFSGSKGSIRISGTNDGKTDRSGGGNIKIGGGRIARKFSKLRDIGKVNRGGEKRNFGGSVGGLQFSNENGDKESNTVNIKMTGGNYGSGRFGGNIKSNSFRGDSGMSEVGGSRSFGERNMFSKTGGNY